MEIPSPPPTTTVAATVKTPDPDSEPPHSNNITKQLQVPPPLTNGVLKRHKPFHHLQPPPVVVTYKECLKNHAATMGGHAIDGCGEFMPSPTSSPSYPTSLKCAACGCHRNFHRREPDESLFPSPIHPPPIQHVIEYQPHHRHHPPPPPPPPPAGVNSSSPGNSPSPPPISSSYYPSAPHMLLALSAGLSAPLPENNNPSIPTTPGSGGVHSGSNPNGKKRFRTKFTQDQKEKMHELAERVGWKMQKRDEELIKGFCNEIGVDKGVFKVWMHNNKMTFGVKNNNNNKDSGGGIDFLTNTNNHNHHHELHNHNQQQEQEQEQEQQGHNDSVSSGGGNVIATNGSSSSS